MTLRTGTGTGTAMGMGCVLMLALVAGCGGGGRDAAAGQARAANASTSGTGDGTLPPAVSAALPSHVSASSLRRSANGCYSYQVGTPDLGYVAPLIAADGAQVCV